jgi:hypothetical protein
VVDWIGITIKFYCTLTVVPSSVTVGAQCHTFENGVTKWKVGVCAVVSRDKIRTSVQRRFRTSFGKEPPSHYSVLKWYRISERKSPGRPSGTEAQVVAVRQAYVRSPGNSIRVLYSRQLNKHHSTVYKILRELLKCKSYKYQLLQKVTEPDREGRYAVCCEF